MFSLTKLSHARIFKNAYARARVYKNDGHVTIVLARIKSRQRRYNISHAFRNRLLSNTRVRESRSILYFRFLSSVAKYDFSILCPKYFYGKKNF